MAGASFAGPDANIEDLSWMTGSWAVALGPNTLEENWIEPTGGEHIADLQKPLSKSIWKLTKARR